MKIFSSNNFHNATKHLKIFSFPENNISGKFLFSGKYFMGTKHRLSEENFRHYMCLDFLKNSFSDEFFHHYISLNIVLVMKYFRH